MLSFHDLNEILPDLYDGSRVLDQKGDWSLKPIEYLDVGIRSDTEEDGYLPSFIKKNLPDLLKKKN